MVLAIIALVEHMPGVAEVCLLPSIHVDKNKIGFYSMVKALSETVFDVFSLHRLQALIDVNWKDHGGDKWATKLGFEFEGVAKHFTADGKDYAVYGKVKNG